MRGKLRERGRRNEGERERGIDVEGEKWLEEGIVGYRDRVREGNERERELRICQPVHIHGKFVTDVFDKRDNFNFHIVNFPFLNSNIPLKPAYGIYMYIYLSISPSR